MNRDELKLNLTETSFNWCHIIAFLFGSDRKENIITVSFIFCIFKINKTVFKSCN